MIINNNLMAINSHRALGMNVGAGQKAMEKLSSGLRVNRAGDDAAGLSISEKMRAQVRGLNQASRNAQDGISLIQTAEGALDEVHSMLQRMRVLAVQSANDTNMPAVDREALQAEINQLLEEIDQVSTRTEFNTQKLLSGGFTNKKLHVGANADQNITISIDSMSASGLGVAGLSVSGLSATSTGGIMTQSGANAAITTINDAINKVSTQRSELGAIQNRLEHTIRNLDNAAENLQAAESRIRDADMAKEMMNFTRTQILQQASIAMLAQANIAPQSVLQLLG